MSSSRKFIPNGDLDFATKAEAFARTLLKDPERFDVPRGEAEELDVAVKRYRATLQTARFGGGRSMAATQAKEDARGAAEVIMRRLGHLLRLNKRLDSASKVLLGIKERTARPKTVPCPQEAPMLRFVRALHEGSAPPRHELEFSGRGASNRAKPDGAARLELFVDLIPPDEPIPVHPGQNAGGRPWYLYSYTRSPIIIAPPIPRVPMRVLYWGRWAGSGSGPENVGPFSSTCAAWIEGGSHNLMPGGLGLQLGIGAARQRTLLDTEAPTQPANRDERYSVAVLEVHYQSFQSHPAFELNDDDDAHHAPRQLEGPAADNDADAEPANEAA